MALALQLPRIPTLLSEITEVETLVDGVTIATDVALGNQFTVTIAGNRTLSAPTNPVDGQKVIWAITQDAIGSKTLTLDPIFVFGTDVTAFIQSTAPNLTDYLGAIYNSTTSQWTVVAIARGF
jgi:hypothetical protein